MTRLPAFAIGVPTVLHGAALADAGRYPWPRIAVTRPGTPCLTKQPRPLS